MTDDPLAHAVRVRKKAATAYRVHSKLLEKAQINLDRLLALHAGLDPQRTFTRGGRKCLDSPGELHLYEGDYNQRKTLRCVFCGRLY